MGFRSRRKKKAANKKRKQRIGKTSIKDLPIDISLNILKRLPKTSLFSVRLVCKAFYQLVGHPTLSPHCQDLLKKPHWVIFRNLSSYIDKPYHNNQLYLVDNWRVVKRIIHPRIKKKFKPGPILSSNGLLCLLFYKDKHSYLDYYRACLFNPLTGKHDFLPDPGLPRVRESNHSGTIRCSNQFFGFGFDARTEEYKLVRILRFSFKTFRTCLQAEMFTCGQNGCRIFEIAPPFICPDQSSDVVVGGAIHWLCDDENSTWFDPKPRIILSFNLFEEKFHEISKPDCEIVEIYKISVLGGCLAITGASSERYGSHEVDIWLWKEYGVRESWTKEFVIKESIGRLSPLFLLNSGKIVLFDHSKGLNSYDTNRDCCEDYAKLNQSIVAIGHAPSLVSPSF
ncbi:hypothetical protein Vadar_017547 [Vaccinium darrowii]|uniref:Uncharacterized protein n=1 Tax=Vaccinium darrowii TaxID=229202 RepID=A0ACB7X1G4_9ERIC|nr:hypothetical protein Vadar_017547 [Vaccinium darrowii]